MHERRVESARWSLVVWRVVETEVVWVADDGVLFTRIHNHPDIAATGHGRPLRPQRPEGQGITDHDRLVSGL